MVKEEVAAELKREPFVPLRVHLRNRKSVKIPHQGAAWLLGYGIVVFEGKKEGSCVATGYKNYSFEDITRIEQLPTKSNGHRRRKAS